MTSVSDALSFDPTRQGKQGHQGHQGHQVLARERHERRGRTMIRQAELPTRHEGPTAPSPVSTQSSLVAPARDLPAGADLGRSHGSSTPDSSPAAAPAAESASRPAGRPGRDRYIDTLRAVALLRVITYHLFGWIWLPILFPSMGVMFALAGSLMAASLDRATRDYAQVLLKRMRRLLPPLWALGAVLLPAMLVLGWTSGEGGTSWESLLLWVVPLATPPASVAGTDWVVPLWYIATYLWLVLLSPMFLWLARRWPLRTCAVPVAVVLLSAAGVLRLEGATGDMILYVCIYAPCWALGFAHHDGKLRRLPLAFVLPMGGALAVAGLAWAIAYPDPESGANVSDVPVATMLYSLGVVLVLLRLYLDFSWMQRVRWLDALIGAINSRAMTIYLWGNAAIALTLWGLGQWAVTSPLFETDTFSLTSGLLAFAGTWVVLGACVLAFGWVEDVAARRRPRLLPRTGVRARG